MSPINAVTVTGEVQMVRGPAVVHVIGRCHVLGMNVSLRTIRVRVGKTLPFEPDKDCRLYVHGESWAADTKNAGTLMWQEIAEKILSLNRATTITVLLAGATDTGKSTFSTYLANLALGQGMKTCIVDGDIGQGDLAPPTALGATVLKEQVVDLRDAETDIFEFVGALSPAGAEKMVTLRLKSLFSRTTLMTGAGPAGLRIINTDGYNDPIYKLMLAKAVWPDVVVIMGRDDLAPALSGPWKMIVIPSSRQVAKTHSERMVRRMEQYTRYIGAKLVSKKIGTVSFQHRNGSIPWKTLLTLGPEGLFVALGSRHRIAGFGAVESMDRQQVSIRTSIMDFSTIHASEIRLNKNQEDRITFFSQVLGR